MAAVAGLQHHHIGMLRLYEEKQGGDEADTLNHEAIHVRQWEECMIASAVLLTVIMLFTGFSIWVYLLCPLWFYLQYGLEYVISYVYHLCRNRCWVNVGDKAYGNSAFEMEAEANEEVDGYLDVRTPFEFFKYYGKI